MVSAILTAKAKSPVVIEAGAVERLMSVPEAISTVREVFRPGSEQENPHRLQVPFGDGDLLTMPATSFDAAGAPIAGVKIVTIRNANGELGLPTVQSVYLLLGGHGLTPLAMIDGPALTNARTAAVSALATQELARPDASRLLMFGAGAQAQAHLTALAAVRELAEVVIVSRGQRNIDHLTAHALELGIPARVGRPEDVARADIVCCCTTSATPLFDGNLLAPGTHVIAVGSYRPDRRELDEATIRRGRVVVEDRDAAINEAGELALLIGAGRYRREEIAADLTEVFAGQLGLRREDDITVFKSVGLAVEDLAIANLVYQRSAVLVAG